MFLQCMLWKPLKHLSELNYEYNHVDIIICGISGIIIDIVGWMLLLSGNFSGKSAILLILSYF